MKNENFTQGKIFTPLVKFAGPVLFALFLQAMYGAVDMLIVGRYGDAADVSAVSTGSQILQTITFAIVALSMGSTILLGQKIGEKKSEDAGDVIGTSIFLFGIIGIIITIGMQFVAPGFAHIMQAPAKAFGGTVSYIKICCGGALFIVAYNVLGSIFRGIGNSKMPLVTVAIACIVNIAGDMLLVGYFNMGVEGAAIATVAAQALSVLLSWLIIKKLDIGINLTAENIRINTAHLKRIITLGLPIALQDILVSVSFLAITAIVNSIGVIASAGVGVAEKICGFIMLVPSAYMQSMSAFVAQNIGAGETERAKKALLYGIMSSLCIGVILAYVSFFHGNILASLFTYDSKIIFSASEYLKAYAIDSMLVSFLFCFEGYFNGCGKTTFVMVQGIAGAFLVRIPVSYLMSKKNSVSLFEIGLATPCSTVLQIILCTIYFVVIAKSLKQKASEH